MELSTVLYRVEGNVAIVGMNRLKAMNSLDTQLFADLTTAFEAAKTDDNVRAVIFTGEGRCFCAGGDIAEMQGITTNEAFAHFIDIAGGFVKVLNSFPKPVIGAAHGAIAGAGTSLLMGCDVVIAADTAMFIVAFGAVGLIPDCGLHYLLPRVVGPNKAKEMMLTQRPVKAGEMLALGIANQVVPEAEMMEVAMKMATKIARGPLNAYSMSKALFNQYAEVSLATMLDNETRDQAAARMSDNGNEGLGAFLEKRKPAFK